MYSNQLSFVMDSNITHRTSDHSLQSLGILIPERNRIKSRHKKYQKRANEALSYITSAFYAKILIILGIALPVTDAVAGNEYGPFDGFYLYLYSGSIIFLLYMYILQMQNKKIDFNLRQVSNNRESTISGDSTTSYKKHQIQYGSFYFRLGVTGFGISSVIYSGLQFGQYFEYESGSECINYVAATKLLLKIIFTTTQIFFIFSYTNLANVQKSRIIARFGLMHMIATNLCEWLCIIVEETQHDIFKSALIYSSKKDKISLYNVDSEFINSSAFQITKEEYENKRKCIATSIMEPILTKTQPYLAPCTVEYSFLCAVILGLMWGNSSQNIIDNEVNSNELPQETQENKRRCNVIYKRSHSYLSVDCAQAHKGLFVGISVLVITAISLIMFFELVTKDDYKDFALLQVNIWEAVLFVTGTIATVFCTLSLRNVGIHRVKRNLELEHLLLLVTQCGVFMYFLFQIIGAVLMGLNKGTGGIMRIITPLTALIQSSWQTLLVLDAWRRRCSTDEEMRLKPGRQLVTFLLVANISLWVVNRLKNNRSVSHPNQMDVYGILPWNIITHVSMPLVVSYRFQSTVCFYEIWKNVYKMRHTPLTNTSDEHL